MHSAVKLEHSLLWASCEFERNEFAPAVIEGAWSSGAESRPSQTNKSPPNGCQKSDSELGWVRSGGSTRPGGSGARIWRLSKE